MTMDAPIPPFTVAICTINRLPFLKRAVEGALRQLEAYPKAQLWVIDNGSSDGTQDYLAGLVAQSDRVHWAHEPRRGEYYTRAAAIERATGAFLVFLDDDAAPREGWPRGMVEFLAKDDSVGVVGCCVDPEWSVAPPAWMSRRHFDTLVANPIEGQPFATAFPAFPPGISLAIRLNDCARLYTAPSRRNGYVLSRVYGDVEAATPELLGGGDTDLCEIYAQNGFKVVMAPQLRVLHHVPAARLTRDWFRRKFRGDGISRIRLLRVTGRPVLGEHGWRVLVAYPFVWLLYALVRTLPFGRLCATLEGLTAKAEGAWHELLRGPKVRQLPYRSDASSNAHRP